MEADKKRYVVTCTIDSNKRSNQSTLEKFGLCDFHSYTMMQVKAVPLSKGHNQIRYFLQLRNPWGTREWLGPWSDNSDTWDKYPDVDEVLRAPPSKPPSVRSPRNEPNENKDINDGRFWILYKDFFKFFYSVTINYTRDDFHSVRISD